MPLRSNSLPVLLLLVLTHSISAWAANVFNSGPGLRSTMPAGYDVMMLKPSGAVLSVMGLIECSELEGAQRVFSGIRSRVVASDGSPMDLFPGHFAFRITASMRKIVLDGPVASLDVPEDPQTLLLNLRFRIRSYNGLDSREIRPESVEMIGVPAEIPYDERVYRIVVNTADVPAPTGL